jgi:hypothetical protein
MNLKARRPVEFAAPPPPGSSSALISLNTQTGMPRIYHSRSRELIYDSLQTQFTFVQNPFGPQKLYVSRPNHHW